MRRSGMRCIILVLVTLATACTAQVEVVERDLSPRPSTLRLEGEWSDAEAREVIAACVVWNEALKPSRRCAIDPMGRVLLRRAPSIGTGHWIEGDTEIVVRDDLEGWQLRAAVQIGIARSNGIADADACGVTSVPTMSEACADHLSLGDVVLCRQVDACD